LSELQVGQRARCSREVTASDIELFTELTGDRNPFHYDEARATAPDKPITKVRTTITKKDGTVVLDGDALVWKESL